MIIWVRNPTPETYEKSYSYHFCQHLSSQSTGEKLVSVSLETKLKDIPALASSPSENVFLFVTHPEIVISKTALDILKKSLDRLEAAAVGPVMNSSPFPRQETSVPFRYFDFPTFMEVVDMYAAKKGTQFLEVGDLDPACFLLAREELENLPSDTEISMIERHLSGNRIVAQGAYIHRYPDYFSADRSDLVELVPEAVKRVLDLGCAKGEYGRTLKRIRPDIFLVGVEQDKKMAELASLVYDLVIQKPVEEAELPENIDLVNMGDILEHLIHPWETLNKLESLLRPGGFIVGSVPNVGHWTVVRNLLEGRFDYVPIGLLCIGHLRYFTKSSLIESLQKAGFQMDGLREDIVPLSPQGQQFIDFAVQSGLGNERSLKTHEFIFRARKART